MEELEDTQIEEIYSIINDDDDFFKVMSAKTKNLFKEAKKDLNLNRFNIQEKSLISSSLNLKWVMLFFKEKRKLKRLKTAKKGYIGKKVEEKSKSKSAFGTPRIQIERQIANSDDNVKKIDKAIKESEELIEFLQSIVEIFNKFGFSIKNATEILKLSEA